MGPAEFITEQGINVRPHPHIGLATVTYLYKGEFTLNVKAKVSPGDFIIEDAIEFLGPSAYTLRKE